MVAPCTRLVAAGAAVAGNPALVRTPRAGLLDRNPPHSCGKRIVDTLIEEEWRRSISDDVMLANQCNEVLKRLLVVALGINQLSKASGDDWLKALDQLGECSDFSEGPGRALGESRFAPDFVTDRRALLGLRQTLTGENPSQQKPTAIGDLSVIEWLWPWAFAALPLPWLVRRLTARHTLQQPALSVPSMDDFAAVTETEHSQAGQSAGGSSPCASHGRCYWPPWPDRSSPAIRLTCRPRAVI